MRRCLLSLVVFCCVLPAQTKKIIANLTPEMVKELAVSAPNIRIVSARGADLAREIEDADAMVGVTLTPELFRHARQLKWLHISSAGVESHGRQVGVFPELAESNVVVTNAKNVYGPQIADHAFAFLLALTRKLNVTIPRQTTGGVAFRTGRDVRVERQDGRHHRSGRNRQPDRAACARVRHEGDRRGYTRHPHEQHRPAGGAAGHVG